MLPFQIHTKAKLKNFIDFKNKVENLFYKVSKFFYNSKKLWI